MAQIGSLVFDVVAKTAGFSKGIGKAKTELTSFDKAAMGVANNLKAAFAGITIVGALRSSVTAFIDAERASNRLAFSLKTMGSDLGITLEQVEKFASKMMRVSIFDDDAIKDAAASLTKFDNISGKNFFTVLTRAMDLASESGKDLLDTVELIGKAVNDPAKAGKILRTLGITGKFSSPEDVLEAMGKLEGQTQARTQTTGGKLQQQFNRAQNMWEDVGKLAVSVPVISIGALESVAEGFMRMKLWIRGVRVVPDPPKVMPPPRIRMVFPINGEGDLGLKEFRRFEVFGNRLGGLQTFRRMQELVGGGGGISRAGGQLEKSFRLMGEGIGKSLAENGKAMKLGLRNPMEEANDTIGELKMLRALGVIDDETFTRGFAQARSGLSAAGKFAAPAGMGSAEAASAIFRNNDPLKNQDIQLAKKQLDALKQQIDLLKGIKAELEEAVQVIF